MSCPFHKSIPVFRPKRRKNPTLWGGTYLYGLYRGVCRRAFTKLESVKFSFMIKILRELVL